MFPIIRRAALPSGRGALHLIHLSAVSVYYGVVSACALQPRFSPLLAPLFHLPSIVQDERNHLQRLAETHLVSQDPASRAAQLGTSPRTTEACDPATSADGGRMASGGE